MLHHIIQVLTTVVFSWRIYSWIIEKNFHNVMMIYCAYTATNDLDTSRCTIQLDYLGKSQLLGHRKPLWLKTIPPTNRLLGRSSCFPHGLQWHPLWSLFFQHPQHWRFVFRLGSAKGVCKKNSPQSTKPLQCGRWCPRYCHVALGSTPNYT